MEPLIYGCSNQIFTSHFKVNSHLLRLSIPLRCPLFLIGRCVCVCVFNGSFAAQPKLYFIQFEYKSMWKVPWVISEIILIQHVVDFSHERSNEMSIEPSLLPNYCCQLWTSNCDANVKRSISIGFTSEILRFW